MIAVWLAIALSLILTPNRLEIGPMVVNGEIVWREKGKTFVKFNSGPMPAKRKVDR